LGRIGNVRILDSHFRRLLNPHDLWLGGEKVQRRCLVYIRHHQPQLFVRDAMQLNRAIDCTEIIEPHAQVRLAHCAGFTHDKP
jgi:hypothetical protein